GEQRRVEYPVFALALEAIHACHEFCLDSSEAALIRVLRPDTLQAQGLGLRSIHRITAVLAGRGDKYVEHSSLVRRSTVELERADDHTGERQEGSSDHLLQVQPQCRRGGTDRRLAPGAASSDRGKPRPRVAVQTSRRFLGLARYPAGPPRHAVQGATSG